MDGLSLSFLGIWVLGDVANVVGAVFTNQLPTVQYTGLYFVLSDVASIAQWLYYKSCYPRRIRRRVGSVFLAHGDESARGDGYMALVEEDEEQEQDYCAERDNDTKADAMRTESRLSGATRNSGSSTTSLGMPRPTTTMIAALALAVCVAAVELDTEMHITNDQPPLCNADSTLARPAVILGMAMSWASGLLYFSSRLPQIMTNWRRKNVAGLSVSLFILTFAANVGSGRVAVCAYCCLSL